MVNGADGPAPPVPRRDTGLCRRGTLASRVGTWQGQRMTTAPPSPPAGGILIALGALGGAGVGFVIGEATPGFLIGTAIGGAAAFAIWWRHRAR